MSSVNVLDDLRLMLSCLSDPDQEIEYRNTANVWISRFLELPESWPVLVHYVVNCPIDDEYLFHVFYLLKKKIKNNWFVLSLDNRKDIKRVLFNWLVQNFHDIPSRLTAQSTLCIAIIGILEVPHNWNDFFEQIFRFVGMDITPGRSTTRITLRILQYFFEELENPGSYLTNKRKEEIREYVLLFEDQIINLLTMCLDDDQPDFQLKEKSIRCFGKFKFSIEKIANEKFLELLFESMTNELLLSDGLQTVLSIFENPEIENLPSKVISTMLNQTIELVTYYLTEEDELDFEEETHLCVLMVEANFKFNDLIIMDKSLSTLFLDLMLTFIMSGTRDIAELALSFWKIYCFKYDQYNENIKSFLFPYLQQFFENLRNQCIYPLEGWQEDESWINYAQKEFFEFRYKIRECFSQYFTNLHGFIIDEICPGLFKDINSGDQKRIRRIEASLFIISNCAKHCPTDNETISYLFGQYDTFDDPKLMRTAVSLVGDYSKWLSFHPQYISGALEYILKAFGTIKSKRNACIALAEFADHCGEQIKGYADEIWKFVGVDLEISSYDTQWIFSALMLLINRLPLDDNSMHLMDQLTNKLIEDISTCIKLPQIPVIRYETKKVLKLLESIAGSILSVKDQIDSRPYAYILEKFFPHLLSVCQIYYNDDEIVELICDILKTSLRNLNGEPFNPFLERTLKMIYENYSLVPFDYYLNVAREIYITYQKSNLQYSSEETRDRVLNILKTTLFCFSETTFSFIGRDLYSRPDTIRNYYELMCSAMATNPILCSLINIGDWTFFFVKTLEVLPYLTTKNSFRSARYFLAKYLSGISPELTQAISSEYHNLVQTLFKCIEEGLSEFKKDIGLLFQDLHELSSPIIGPIIVEYLHSNHCPTNLSDSNKLAFITMFQGNNWNEDTFNTFFNNIKGYYD